MTGSRLRTAVPETLRDGRWSEGRDGRSNARPMPPLGAFRSPLVVFSRARVATGAYWTRRTRSEGFSVSAA
jgi:hypothetical protein